MKLHQLLPIGAALGALAIGCSEHSEERIVVAPETVPTRSRTARGRCGT